MKWVKVTFIFVFITLVSTVISGLIPEYRQLIRAEMCLFGIGSILAISLFSYLLFKKAISYTIHIHWIDGIMLLIVSGISLSFMYSSIATLDFGFLLLSCMVLFSYVCIRVLLWSDSNEKGRTILNAILLFGLAQCVYAILEQLAIIPNLYGYHIGGTYGNPGDLANFLIIAYSIALGLFIHSNGKMKWLYLGSFLFILYVMIVSLARTSWIATSLVSAILLQKYIQSVFTYFQKKYARIVRISIIVTLILLCIVSSYTLYAFKKGSSDGRLFIWQRCIELIAEKPLWGYGYEAFIPTYNSIQCNYFEHYPTDEKNKLLADNIVYAYNDFLQTGVEYGIVGIFALILLFYLAFGKVQDANIHKQITGQICNAALSGILLSMLFSYPLQNVTILVVLGLLLAIKISLFQGNKSFSISTNWSKYINALLVLLSVCTLWFSIQYLQKTRQWKAAYDCSQNGKPGYPDQYKKLFPFLKFDRAFLFNYGSILHEAKMYNECICHFVDYQQNFQNIEGLMILADCYDQVGNYEEAEKIYLQACNTIPNRFVPNYFLFQLYTKTKQLDKAVSLAGKIKEMKVKVYSESVKYIKTEISDFLINNK